MVMEQMDMSVSAKRIVNSQIAIAEVVVSFRAAKGFLLSRAHCVPNPETTSNIYMVFPKTTLVSSETQFQNQKFKMK